MEENHSPCSHLQNGRNQDARCKYCLTEQRAVCAACSAHCVGLTHLCVNLPLTYKEYTTLKQSQNCYVVKGSSFLRVGSNVPLRTAVDNFCAASGLSAQQHRITDPSGNLFDSSTLQPGYVYLLIEVYSVPVANLGTKLATGPRGRPTRRWAKMMKVPDRPPRTLLRIFLIYPLYV